MSWIVLAFALEVGWMPQGDFLMHEPTSIVTLQGMFYVDLDARITLWGSTFVGGEVKTIMWKGERYSFSPERMLYQFNAGIKLDPLELGWRHYCTHPMWTYLQSWKGTARWEGAYEEVYLRLEIGEDHE
jgi:hypothetical protein